ncbi:MAG: hypothetical protein ACOC0C_02780 [Bacteroidota bacterium]
MNRYLFATFLFLLCSCQDKNDKIPLQEQYHASTKNLIPDNVLETYNCWLPEQVQNQPENTMQNNDRLSYRHTALPDEQELFGHIALASFFLKVRNDVFVVFDYGWDIIPNASPGRTPGNFMINESLYPACAGRIVERLSCINDLSKKNGMKGAGVWVPIFSATHFDSASSSINSLRDYYMDRIEWSVQSGIRYWKTGFIDSVDPSTLKLVVSMAQEMAPDLIIENSQHISPLNDYACPWDTVVCQNTGTFSAWGNGLILNQAVEFAGIGLVFFTGDVTSPLYIPTTLERVAQLMIKFTMKNTSGAVVNCGDSPYMAAALGCAMQIKRHPLNYTGLDDNMDLHRKNKKFDEVIRALRWQRIAPAFAIGESTVEVDAWRLKDEWVFSKNTPCDWLAGERVIQNAPGRVSRGMPLPEVKDTTAYAYAVATRYPNAATAIATLPRTGAGSGAYHPRNDVLIMVDEWEKPIGVFGRYNSLTIKFERLPNLIKVYGQDLAGSRAIDITEYVVINKNSLMLTGELIDEVGTLAASTGDLSDPGLLIQIEGVFK